MNQTLLSFFILNPPFLNLFQSFSILYPLFHSQTCIILSKSHLEESVINHYHCQLLNPNCYFVESRIQPKWSANQCFNEHILKNAKIIPPKKKASTPPWKPIITIPLLECVEPNYSPRFRLPQLHLYSGGSSFGFLIREKCTKYKKPGVRDSLVILFFSLQ